MAVGRRAAWRVGVPPSLASAPQHCRCYASCCWQHVLLDIGLPKPKYEPAFGFQIGRNSVISRDVSRDLTNPVVLLLCSVVASERVDTLLTDYSAMPVVSIYKDGDLLSWKDNIRSARHSGHILPISESHSVQGSAQCPFYSIIL